jgi:hypothetical protein
MTVPALMRPCWRRGVGRLGALQRSHHPRCTLPPATQRPSAPGGNASRHAVLPVHQRPALRFASPCAMGAACRESRNIDHKRTRSVDRLLARCNSVGCAVPLVAASPSGPRAATAPAPAPGLLLASPAAPHSARPGRRHKPHMSPGEGSAWRQYSPAVPASLMCGAPTIWLQGAPTTWECGVLPTTMTHTLKPLPASAWYRLTRCQ